MCNIRPLPAVLAKKAADELNENPNEVQTYLDALKHWITRQQHLSPRTEDQFLIAFLRGSKFSLERCKQKIDYFYRFRSMMPELFKNRDVDDPKVLEILRLGPVLHLPQSPSEDGPRVIMMRFGAFDFHKYTLVEIFKVGIMMADLCLYDDDNAIVSGYIMIMDLADVTPFHLIHFDPMFAKKITIMLNKVLPSRMKGFHFINMLPAFEKCFNMVKGAINVKLQKRFYFHSNTESLYQYVPKHCLPAEYGGDSDTIQDIVGHWETKLKKNKDFFIEEDTIYGCNEKLREEKEIITDSLFGSDGSFRKLNID